MYLKFILVWWMCSKEVLPIIEISSIIINLRSASNILIYVFFWSDIAEKLSLVSLGIAKVVFIVVPFILIAATLVGAINRTVGNSEFIGGSVKVVGGVWYMFGISDFYQYLLHQL